MSKTEHIVAVQFANDMPSTKLRVFEEEIKPFFRPRGVVFQIVKFLGDVLFKEVHFVLLLFLLVELVLRLFEGKLRSLPLV